MKVDGSLEWNVSPADFAFAEFIQEIFAFYRRDLDGLQNFEHPFELLGVDKGAEEEPAVLESDELAAKYLQGKFSTGARIFAPLTDCFAGYVTGDRVPFVDGAAYPADSDEAGSETEYGLVMGMDGTHLTLLWRGRDAINAWLKIEAPTSFDQPLQRWMKRFLRP